MRLRLTQALECALCRQLVLAERQSKDAMEWAMLGFAAYAVCPSCGLTVADHRDRNYRRRVRRWMRTHNRRESP